MAISPPLSLENGDTKPANQTGLIKIYNKNDQPCWINAAGTENTFANGVHTHSTDNLTSGTLPLARGGTGATALSAGFVKSTGTALTTGTIAQTDVTGLVADLEGKAASSHTHTQADVMGLTTQLPNTIEFFDTNESRPNGVNAITNRSIRLGRLGTLAYAYNEAAEFRLGHGGSSVSGSKLDLYICGESNSTSVPDQHCMTWQCNGMVGIGTTTPLSGLHIVGMSEAGGSITFGSSGAEDANWRWGYLPGAGMDAAQLNIYAHNTRTLHRTIMTALSNGNVGIGSAVPAYALDVAGTVRATSFTPPASDVRFKENIAPIDNSLAQILQLRPVDYEWVEKEKRGDSPQVGFIAQEIEEVFPKLVFSDNDGFKYLDYGKLTTYLVKAIQEQQAQIEKLEAKVAELVDLNAKTTLP